MLAQAVIGPSSVLGTVLHTLVALTSLCAMWDVVRQYVAVIRTTARVSLALRATAKTVLKVYVPRAKVVFGLSVMVVVCGPLLLLIVPVTSAAARPILIVVLLSYVTAIFAASFVRNMFLDLMIPVLQAELISGPQADSGALALDSLLST